MITRIIKIALEAMDENPHQAWRDSQWYNEAGAWCNCVDADYDLHLGTTAGFIAALSPLNTWHDQLRFTPPSIAAGLELIRHGQRPHEGIRGPGFFANRDKAARILQGEAPLAVLGGDKVTRFFRNLIGDLDCVTIDRHAIAIAGYTGKGLSAAGVPTSHLYKRIEFAFRMAGESLDMSGAEVQALTWCHWRRNHSAFANSNREKGQ